MSKPTKVYAVKAVYRNMMGNRVENVSFVSLDYRKALRFLEDNYLDDTYTRFFPGRAAVGGFVPNTATDVHVYLTMIPLDVDTAGNQANIIEYTLEGVNEEPEQDELEQYESDDEIDFVINLND